MKKPKEKVVSINKNKQTEIVSEEFISKQTEYFSTLKEMFSDKV